MYLYYITLDSFLVSLDHQDRVSMIVATKDFTDVLSYNILMNYFYLFVLIQHINTLFLQFIRT